jgi:hypothetical protein
VSDDEDGYRGPATLVFDDAELAVELTLRGNFEPVDGRYHWYGRVAVDEALTTRLGGRQGRALVRTPHGEAQAQLADPDPWGRYRITGTSRPPFDVPTSLEDLAEH